MKYLQIFALILLVSVSAIAGQKTVAVDTVSAGGISFSAYANFTTDSASIDTIKLGRFRASWYQILLSRVYGHRYGVVERRAVRDPEVLPVAYIGGRDVC